MFSKAALVSFLLAAGVIGAPEATSQSATCPEVWNYIAKELKYDFIDDYGFCTDYARQSIRLPFHDCFPGGGCDGSIVLTDECFNRFDNERLIPICAKLRDVANRYKVGVADLINLAGAIGNKACRYGPYTPFYIGRTDNPVAALEGQLPPSILPAPTLISVFAARGFTDDELVALVGAHSAGKNHTGVPFDTTVGELDSWTYYTETRDGGAPTTLPSDFFLSQYGQTRDSWNVYAVSQEAWAKDYVDGYKKLITLDNDVSKLSDCTEVVFKAFPWNDDDDPCVYDKTC
ncbi:hypothetical protein LA080_009639 [Diaporthe eres]|uniref:Peroxidase n=1 Tax=Diaporthe vaccinii TaxID=105482 RepID=A0ABR4FAU3_9PEZI|nr:hypothetical protein LA080_009639 [Diaporthe eres]